MEVGSSTWRISWLFCNVIAGNFEAYQLHIIPEQVEDFRYVVYRLKDLLELSDENLTKY